MSLTYASRRARPLFWCAAIVLSGALHAGLPVLLLDHDALDKRAEPQAEGITGAMKTVWRRSRHRRRPP